MKTLFILIFILTSSYSIGQTYFGIPFLDQCRKMGSCPVCDSDDKNLKALDEKFANEFETRFMSKKYSDQNYKDQINYIDSFLLIENQNELFKAKLLYIKIHIYMALIEDGDEVYNFAISIKDSLNDFSGPKKIIDLFDEIINLDIDEDSKLYFQNAKLSYYTGSYLIYEFDRTDYKLNWVSDQSKRSELTDEAKELADNYVQTKSKTTYNPFFNYDAYGIGLTSAIGNDTWVGYEISFDVENETMNPFRRYHPFLGYRNDYRLSWFSSKFLINKELSKADLAVSICDFKNWQGFKINLIQFGLHYSDQFEAKLFYRPEIGYSYGIFSLTYSYNYTFNENIRPLTEKHMVNLTLSYPLIRIGKYY